MADQTLAPTEPFKDYYQFLHLHPHADAAMVDQAYWHLARLYNAEFSTDPDAKRKLDELNEAYSVLRSPPLRKAYDQMRNELLGEGTLPETPEPEPAAPPLAVMMKQRPHPREQQAPDEPREAGRFRVSAGLLAVLPWQSMLGVVAIAALAAAALLGGVQPALVLALLVVGLALMMVPLVRKLPSFSALPASDLHLPTLRAPRLAERRTTQPMDTDTLRRSTEAMRRRWREEVETRTSASPMSPLSPPDTTPDSPSSPDSPS